jgi:hypothetical protein
MSLKKQTKKVATFAGKKSGGHKKKHEKKRGGSDSMSR